MISVLKGDITKVRCDAIVNPANSYGTMGGGVALAIKRAGGDVIEKEAMTQAPIPVGEAIATRAGTLQCKYVIHASTMKNPGERISATNVLKAVRAALECASSLSIQTLAFPGMGTGTGGVDPEEAAKAMIKEINEFPKIRVYLVAYNKKLFRAFKKVTK